MTSRVTTKSLVLNSFEDSDVITQAQMENLFKKAGKKPSKPNIYQTIHHLRREGHRIEKQLKNGAISGYVYHGKNGDSGSKKPRIIRSVETPKLSKVLPKKRGPKPNLDKIMNQIGVLVGKARQALDRAA